MNDPRDPQGERRRAAARGRMATNAETMADLSEALAVTFDSRADASGDEDGRRRATAAWEREVAAVERRNAERIRAGATGGLEPLPERPEPAGGPLPR